MYRKMIGEIVEIELKRLRICLIAPGALQTAALGETLPWQNPTRRRIRLDHAVILTRSGHEDILHIQCALLSTWNFPRLKS